jgi:hypothetical protein
VPLAHWHCPDLARQAAAQGIVASISGALGVTVKNIAWMPSWSARCADGGALSVTSRPPRRVRL